MTIAKDENNQGLTYIDAGDSLYNFIKHNRLMPITKDNLDPVLIDDAMEYGNKLYIELRKKKVTETVIKNQSFRRISDMEFEKKDLISKYAREFVVNKFLLKMELNELLQKINIEMLKY